MSLTRRIAQNLFLQIAGKIISTLLALIIAAIMTRSLGVVHYGEFTIITSFLQFFGILADFGLTITAVTMISEPGADERRIMSSLLGLRLVSAVIFYGLAPIVAFFLPYPTEVKIGVAMASLAFLAMTQSQTLMGIFQKYLRLGEASLAEILGRIIMLIIVVIAAWQKTGLYAVIWAMVAGNVAQFLFMHLRARRIIPFSLQFDRQIIREIIKRSWPIGLTIAFNLIYLRGDVIVLSLFRETSEVGLYGAAYKVIDVLTVLPMMFMGLVMPHLVQSWIEHQDTFRARLQKIFDFSALLALPIAGGALMLGREIMNLVAGREFAASGDFLKILILAGLGVFLAAPWAHALLAIGAQRKTIFWFGLDALLAVPAYLILVPIFGARGAAWITVFSEIFIGLATFILIVRLTDFKLSLKPVGKMLLATILMMIALWPLREWPVLLTILIGALVYGGLVLILRVISREMIRDLIPKKI